MDEQANHEAPANGPDPHERVVIEDYPGPGYVLPSSAPDNSQIASLPETKQEPVSESQTHRTIPPLARSLTAAVVGFITALIIGYIYLPGHSFAYGLPAFFIVLTVLIVFTVITVSRARSTPTLIRLTALIGFVIGFITIIIIFG